MTHTVKVLFTDSIPHSRALFNSFVQIVENLLSGIEKCVFIWYNTLIDIFKRRNACGRLGYTMDISSLAAVLAADTTDQMQNIYIPLPLGMHIGFCIIATIVYILEIYRKKSRHYFFMMLAVDATLLMQVFPNSTMVVILAIIEALLLGAAGVMAYMEHKKNKLEQQAEAEKTAAEQAQQISDGEANENSDT